MLDPKDPGARDELRAWLALHESLHLHPGDAVRWLAESRGDPRRALRRSDRTAPRRASLDERMEQLAALGAQALPLGSALYPAGLAALRDAAPLLLVRGLPGALAGRCAAIVGARAATVYGVDVASRLGRALAGAGVVTVSGLARGIDAAAHRGALDAGGLTVAFSACGLDRVYPPEHEELAERIVERGALVTEMPLGTPPLPHYFPLRNRLIAGLAEVVVVVEARRRSGSLSTARRALDCGRDVMAVPGPIDAPTSAGPHALLADGARPICQVGDLLDAMGLEASESGSAPASPELDGPARRLLESLRARPATRDELLARAGSDAGELAVALVELELAGRITTDRDGRLKAVGEA